MRITYITAGAAGMFCGSCMHDNTLVAALCRQGHDALLVPTYTPIRTDEEDVSQKRVFFGGINVYLQQKFWLFRHTPWLLDRLLDVPGLLRWVSRFAMKTQAEELAELTVSMLKGEHGRQRKEVDKIVRWLAGEVRPEVVNLTNALLSGMVHELKRHLKVPVLCSLQGDDIYLESLPEPARTECLNLIRDHCREMDGFVATSAYYADFMSGYFSIPRERIHVVHPGLNLHGHGDDRELGRGQETTPERAQLGRGLLTTPQRGDGRPFTIGYFARICPEKGLHVLTEAFRRLRRMPGVPACKLRVSGWLGEQNRPYFEKLLKELDAAGLGGEVEHVESPDHASKVRFLQSLDVLSVPTTYREPKGLYVLEALANGVPVVQPRHGSFPELIDATGGGLLVNPDDPDDLAGGLRQLLDDPARRDELGRRGKAAVHERFHADRMARETAAIYARYAGISS
jgi:glycosyltransferase involved in cell wall biosynthesis